MAKDFGKTTWGDYFLTALNRFYSYDARVARGRRYAKGGRVFDIKIKSNNITAKVEGNWNPFYKTAITFTRLKKDEIEKIYEIIKSDPLVLAAIMDGKLQTHCLMS